MLQKNKTIWITGIAGFLGSHLAEALSEQGYIVVGNDSLVCGDRANVPEHINCYEIDCRDFDDMKLMFDTYKPDIVVHAAATAHEGLSVFSPSFITKNIYEASVTTFSAAIASGAEHIVYLSSMSRYGAGEPFPPPFKEDLHVPSPEDPYAVAKVGAEITLRLLCEEHGIKWSIAVPHNIIGVKQRYCDPFRNVASIMINRCLQGKAPIIYGDGEQKRCFSPIADCLDSLLKIITEDAGVSQVINIGPDCAEISINDLASMVMELTGFSDEPIHFPDRPREVKEAFCSSDKARRLLGYKPKQEVRACLAEMVEDIKLKGAKEFIYDFPLEINNDKTPKTWSKKLI